MISQTFAADAFSPAWLVSTIAVRFVLLASALSHIAFPLLIVQPDSFLPPIRNYTELQDNHRESLVFTNICYHMPEQ